VAAAAVVAAVTLLVCPAYGAGRAPEASPRPAFADANEDSVADGGTRDKAAIKEEMARIGRGDVAGTRQWEREKSATVAMLSSMVLPGLGQLYNGRKYKAMIATGIFTYYLGTAWFEQKKSQEYLVGRDALPPNTIAWQNQDILYNFHKDNAVTYLWWSGAVWLITVLDAYVDAHLYDVRAVTPTVVRGAGDTKYVALSFGF
jgi:hypothetical protein